MENQMQVFNNEQFGDVRTVLKDGEPWFVVADVCAYFGVANRNRIMQTVDSEDKGGTQMDTPGGVQTVAIVNESGLYSVLFALQPTKARGVSKEHIEKRRKELHDFRRWITHEVIPAIRKTGGYIAGEENMTDDELVAKALLITAEKLKQREARIAALSAQIEEDRPYTRFGKSISASDSAILLGDFAKVAANSGIPIGRNRLFKWLRDNKYLMPDNKPYQRYVDQGVFAVKESKVFTGFEETIRTTTLVTGKGQKYLMERLERGA